MSTAWNRSPIATFLGITLILSGIFYFLIIRTGRLGSGFGLYVTGLMWCPGIAAIITTQVLGRSAASLGWRWGKTKYQLWSYLIPFCYGLVAYLIIWIMGWGIFYNKEFVEEIAIDFGLTGMPDGFVMFFFLLLAGIIGMAGSSSSALGEEIGWRGFLVPELSKRFNYTQISLISGIIWGVWHIPVLVFADYNSGTPVWYGLSCFLIMVVSVSFIMTWLRLKTNSLWTGVFVHASHNLFIQSIFTPMTETTEQTKYYIDEFGVVVPIICMIAAIYFWTRRAEVTIVPANTLSEEKWVEPAY